MRSFLLSTVLALAASFVAASPVEVDKRDVWTPPVLYPNSGTVWKVGNHHNVTWSTANPPPRLDNNTLIALTKGGLFVSGPGGVDQPLASGFSLLDGRVEIQVPNVPTGSDYTVVLFGDSGNDSAQFTIEQ